MQDTDAAQRRQFLKEAVVSAGAGLWSGTFCQRLGAADKKQRPAESVPIGRRELVKGLDGMSRVAEPGQNPFIGGHTAATVLSSAFFCPEQKIDADTRKEILSLGEARLLKSSIYAPRPEAKSDPEAVERLIKDLNAGIDTLRRNTGSFHGGGGMASDKTPILASAPLWRDANHARAATSACNSRGGRDRNGCLSGGAHRQPGRNSEQPRHDVPPTTRRVRSQGCRGCSKSLPGRQAGFVSKSANTRRQHANGGL